MLQIVLPQKLNKIETNGGPYVLSGGPLIFTFSFFSQGLLVKLGYLIGF